MSISCTTAFKDAIRGTVDRSQIRCEIYFSGALGWVDVTAYLEEMSGTQEEVSQLSGGASANTLNLTLINDDGRFSPKHTSGPYYGNLTPNKPIRVSAVYGSESVRIFTGYISNWIPNAKSRNCQVTAEDAARILRRRDITEETVFNSAAPTTGYYLTRVIERAAYLSGLRWDAVTTKTADWTNPDQDGNGVNEITPTYNGAATRATYTLSGALVMTLDLVDLLLPVSPLKGKALAVLDSLAKVVDGCIYFDAQGQLVFRSRMYRNDSTLSSVETFTVSSLEDATSQQNFEDSKWAQIVNRATVRSTPWAFKTDSAGAVVEEEIPFKGDLFGKHYFTAGETYPGASDADLWCEIPSGIKLFKTASYPTAANLVLRSVLDSDPTNETNNIGFYSGFPVFEQTRIKVKLTNNGSAAERLQMLTFKGKLMRPIQRCQSIQTNAASITLYDQRDKEVSNDFIPTATACKQLAAWLVEDGREPKTVLTLPVMYGVPWLELGDKITVSETVTNTVPAAEDFIVRRISWRWSLAAFAFILEACSPAATFSAGSIPGTVTNVETVNQNHNGQQASMIPPQAIDGTQNLIGLNNFPAFTQVTGSVRSLTNSTIGSSINGMAFYKGYIWAVSSDGYVWKIDPMTMQSVNQWQIDASSAFIDCKVYGQYLYIADSYGGWSTSSRIIWFDMDNPGTVSGTNWNTKVDLGLLASDPLYNPRFLLVRGNKLYIHAREYFNPAADSDSRLAVIDISSNATVSAVDANVATTSGAYSDSRLAVIDISSNATVSAVDANVATTSGAYDAVSNQVMYADGYIWTISDDNPTTALIMANTSAGATSITVNDASGFRVGQPVKVGLSSVDYVWISAINSNTLTVTPAMTYAHTNTEYVYGQDAVITKVDPATNTVVSRTTVDDGHDGQGLEWDGSYLWATFADRIVRYSLTSGTLVANLSLTATAGSAGSVQFDGSYIWWTRAGSVKQLDGKSGRLIASFTDASTTGGLILFDGRSIFKSGSSGTIYQIPRWLSRQS